MKRGARAYAADVDFVVLDAADHVHVEHGHGFVERPRWFFHPLRRTKQAQFLAGKRGKKNAAMELAFHRRQTARQFEHAGGAGGVIVGAGMDLADLRWGQRIEIAPAQVIIVRAHNHVLIGFTGEVGKHVVDGGLRGFNVHFQRKTKVVRKRKGCRLGCSIDLALDIGQRFSGRAKPGFHGRVLCLDEENSAVDRPADAAKSRQQIFFTLGRAFRSR